MIRLAAPSDLTGMLDLYQHLNPTDPRVTEATAAPAWAAMLGSELIHLFVAEEDGLLVSSCTLVIVPNITRGARSYALIENVVTHAGYRGRGLGRAITASLAVEALATGATGVWLEMYADNAAAARAYRAVGFEEMGRYRSALRDGPSSPASEA